MTQQTRKRGLGRGLGAIFQDAPTQSPEAASDTQGINGAIGPNGKTADGVKGAAADHPAVGVSQSGGLRTLPISELVPGEFQPRRVFDEDALSDLAASIRSKGVLEPLIVRMAQSGSYEIIAGERRWRAAQMAQLHEVPVIIRILSDVEALEIALIENIQREDLSPLEEARAYEQLIDQFSYTQEQLAGALGRSRSHVTNMMRLLKLPSDVQDMVEGGQLTAGHARALLASESPKRLAEDVVRKGLNVRQTERLVSDVAKGGGRARRPSAGLASDKDADTRAMETALTDALGVKVGVVHREDGSGEMTLTYANVDQLDDIARRLQGNF